MRAAVFHGREDLRLEDIPEPRTGKGEVKLKVLYNGICGSDLHEYYHGPMTTRTTPHPLTGVKNPIVMGHELCGEVVEIGAGIDDLGIGDKVAVEPGAASADFAIGNRVGVEPVETCGHCLYCSSGQYNHCGLLAFHGYNRSS